MYPSEYAYHADSVTRAEVTSANCKNYPQGNLPSGIHPENYIICNGTQLRLVDSELGSEQYSSSEYYVWPVTKGSSQLLFNFPTRVTVTTITLHYYSDNIQRLPRLRFFAVPDDFEIWDAPIISYSYVEVTAMQLFEEPADQRKASVYFNLLTKKVLLSIFGSSFKFAMSELNFFSCNGELV